MGNGTKPTQRDIFTGYPVTVSSDHAYIHKGRAFTLSGKSGSVAAAGTFVLSFVTPAKKYIHIRPTRWGSTSNLGEMRIAEASTFSVGSAATPLNRNRNKAETAESVLKTGVTMTVEGTILDYDQTGSGGNVQSRSGGGNGENEEWVFKPSTTYTIRFENTGATTATVFYYSLFWYEEDQGA